MRTLRWVRRCCFAVAAAVLVLAVVGPPLAGAQNEVLGSPLLQSLPENIPVTGAVGIEEDPPPIWCPS